MRRGQATVETAIGVLIATPVILFALFLAEAGLQRARVVHLSAEPLWDATAWPQHSYAAASFDSPSAVAAARVDAMNRHQPRAGLFLVEDALAFDCLGSGQGLAFSVAGTASFYRDLGAARCTARSQVSSRWLPQAFAEEQQGGFSQARLADIRRRFELCATDDCGPGFRLMLDDWGLTRLGNEGEECAVTMTGCANQGFFRAGRTVYDAFRTGSGTRGRADIDFVTGMFGLAPANFDTLHDFQMSSRGEESAFEENVPVIEGQPNWATTPNATPWSQSYAARRVGFLGR